jgi:copper(I)-binding protein
VISASTQASSSGQTLDLFQIFTGKIWGQAAGSNVAITLTFDSAKVVSSAQGTQEAPKPFGDASVRLVLSSLGILRDASISGNEIDPERARIQSLLETFKAAFGDLAKLPEDGFHQDQVLSASSQIAGIVRLHKMTVRGQGVYQHRPVLVIDVVGDFSRIQDGARVGHIEGFELIDRATGMWLLYDTHGS